MFECCIQSSLSTYIAQIMWHQFVNLLVFDYMRHPSIFVHLHMSMYIMCKTAVVLIALTAIFPIQNKNAQPKWIKFCDWVKRNVNTTEDTYCTGKTMKLQQFFPRILIWVLIAWFFVRACDRVYRGIWNVCERVGVLDFICKMSHAHLFRLIHSMYCQQIGFHVFFLVIFVFGILSVNALLRYKYVDLSSMLVFVLS